MYGISVSLKFQPHERIFYDILAPGNIGEMGLHYTKLEEMARSAVIQKRNYKAILTASFFQPIMKNKRPKTNEIF